MHIQLRYSVFIDQSWQDGEGGTGLRNNGDCYSSAHTELSFLDFKIVEQSSQDILRSEMRGGYDIYKSKETGNCYWCCEKKRKIIINPSM